MSTQSIRAKIFPQKPQNLGTSLSNEDVLYHKLSQDMNEMEDLRTRIEEGESCIISEEDFNYSNNRDNLYDSLLG